MSLMMQPIVLKQEIGGEPGGFNATMMRRVPALYFMNWFKRGCQAVVLTWLLCLAPASHAGSYEDFFRAVELDDGRAVRRLVARGFDANAPSPQGQVAFYLAMRDGALNVAEALLDAPGLDVDRANPRGETPLMMAALKGRLLWSQKLVQMGAAVRRQGWTPLHYAASGVEGENDRVAAFLLERGAEVDAVAPWGTTALMLAAGYGSEATIRVLLAHDADIARRNERGLTAADFARQSGRERLAEALAELIGKAEGAAGASAADPSAGQSPARKTP